ncbi:MAG TPA: hypothetical protein VEC11_13975 [Allosphingosinicella sp.]|nr:hypothetical protein [Allosphingosinicella sp.]
MKILAGLLAATLLATPLFAQGGTATTPPAAGADQGKPPADEPERTATNTPDGQKPAAEPEPDEAPEGTTPDKPADEPSR